VSQSDQRYLSAAEAAKALGVTTRALRLYEQKGLVKPARTVAGWRAYGPDALTRLHQILALKGLGLSLSRVGELLRGRLVSLEAVLALQEEALALRQAETQRALALVRRAKARITAGQTLSMDDLTTLTRETTMSDPKEAEMKAIFEPLIAKHYDADSLETLSQRPPFDQAAISRAWADLHADANAAMAKGDPTTPEAMDVARRWDDLVGQFTGGDSKIAASLANVWKDALSDPSTAPKLNHSPGLMEFVQKAREAALKAAG
jgi:DNA-binding transcriptional MerR regulator